MDTQSLTQNCKECGLPLSEVQTARENLFCGYSCASKARARHRSANGLYHKKFSDAVVRKAIELVNQGVFWKQAANSIGMSHDSFRKRTRKLEGVCFRIGPSHKIAPMRLKLPEFANDIGYLAGILDGEGTICIHKGKRQQVIVSVANTDSGLMQWLSKIGGVVAKRKPCKLSKKQPYVWTICARRDAEAVLRLLSPFLKIKRVKALRALRALESYKDQFFVTDSPRMSKLVA